MQEIIEQLRNQIDVYDKLILHNILDRLELVKSIHKIKKKTSELIVDIDREKQIVSSLISEIREIKTQNLIKSLYTLIFQEVKSISYPDSSSVSEALFSLLEKNQLVIAGPCAVENQEQISGLAEAISALGVKFFRGGIYKARTNPNSFQGLRENGLEMYYEAAKKFDLYTVSEFLDIEQAKSYFEFFDVIMIGSRNMSNFEFLAKIGKLTAENNKPVILKRGFASTVDEFLSAAEYITREGNTHVILCLRGIRTYEEAQGFFRFPPDFHSLLEIRDKSDLKVIFDPSHSSGNSKIVPKVAKSAVDLGFNGIILEVHNNAENALSDKNQQISSDELGKIIEYLKTK
ncbi:MAG: 3-deoxy-7-phosphoheptulonate synthase [Ignavibacteria bacterium GWF2_33_9]|nr:MAG: 3-deoxy-7-phosphoheptulonate synthase [Ignavibacteria bacterium GWF2_33_9]